MQAQAPICPFCCDDHSRTMECKAKDLKLRYLVLEIEHILYDIQMHKTLSVTEIKKGLENVKRYVEWL